MKENRKPRRRRLLLILPGILLLLWLILFVSSRIRTKRDLEFLRDEGYEQLVSAGDYSVNVIRCGNENGAHRIIAMAGFGIPDCCITMRRMTAHLEQENQVPSWEYYFTKDNGRLGCWHSGELVYTFGVIPEGSKLYTEEDRALADTMHGCWVSFVKTGDPGKAWDQDFTQSPDSSTVMEFGGSTGMREDPCLALYQILDRMYGWE